MFATLTGLGDGQLFADIRRAHRYRMSVTNVLLGRLVLRYDGLIMNARVKKFLRGAGSVMDIAPARDLRRLAPRMTTAERMSGHFTRVGESMSRACGTFENNGQAARHNKKTA